MPAAIFYRLTCVSVVVYLGYILFEGWNRLTLVY